MSCYYLICISQKKRPKTTSTKKPKEERTNPKNTRPDIKRIFPNTFGSEPAKKQSKNIGKNPPKNTRPTTTPKNKSSHPKIFQKATLRREERQKNDERRRTRHKKHKMEKTDSISPFEKGEQTNTSTLPCVTVRLPLVIGSHPLPGLFFTAFGRKGVGGGGETDLARWTACGPPVLTRAPKHDHNNRKGVRNDRSPTPTCGKTVHYTSCMQRRKATHQPNTPNPDRDQTNQDQPPPNQRTTTTKKKKTRAGA